MRLCPFKKTDASCLLNWIEDEESMFLFGLGFFQYPLTMEQVLSHIEIFENRKDAFIFAALDDDGEVIGHITIRNIDYKTNSAHLGFIIIDPTKRGQGYGKKLVSSMLVYAKDCLALERVTLNVFLNNEAALHCYESLGFNKEERIEEIPYNDKTLHLARMNYIL